jgi:hypothetical protein
MSLPTENEWGGPARRRLEIRSQKCEHQPKNVPRTRVVLYQEDETAPFLKWFDALPRKAQAKCQAYLLQLEEFGHELKRPNRGLPARWHP